MILAIMSNGRIAILAILTVILNSMMTSSNQDLDHIEDEEENTRILSLSEDDYRKMQKVKLHLRSRDCFQIPYLPIQKLTRYVVHQCETR